MKVKLSDLFVDALSDVYSAEKQLTKALPKLARASTNPALKDAFQKHLEETLGQVDRIDRAIKSCDMKLRRVRCAAMEGLIENGQEQIDTIEKGPILDAALIAAAQKIEHYEIPTYATLASWAKELGYIDAMTLLLETLAEEKATDEKLTILGQQEMMEEAAVGGYAKREQSGRARGDEPVIGPASIH
jgi:ferritin-like metal-binding protein YciE